MDNLFFFFSKIFTLFLYPFTLIIIIGIIGIIYISGKKNKLIASIPLILLFIFSSNLLSQFLIGILENKFPPIEISNLEKADAIVVLGGAINILGKYPTRIEMGSSSERMTDALLIYKSGKSDSIVFTGGSGILFQQELREANFAKKFFMDFGIPESSLIMEEDSKNTYENAVFTSRILERLNKKKIILITSAFHMERSLRCFQNRGLIVQAFPTDYKSLRKDINWDTMIPNPGYLETSTIAIKELIGIWVYNWKGYYN